MQVEIDIDTDFHFTDQIQCIHIELQVGIDLDTDFHFSDQIWCVYIKKQVGNWLSIQEKNYMKVQKQAREIRHRFETFVITIRPFPTLPPESQGYYCKVARKTATDIYFPFFRQDLCVRIENHVGN